MEGFPIELSTALAATADEVWAHACTMDGVDLELRPWVRVTVPWWARGVRISDVEPTLVGCTVHDRLTVVPRRTASFLARPIVRAIFASRHRRLRALFGDAA